MMEWKLISIGKGIGVEADAFCNAYWQINKHIVMGGILMENGLNVHYLVNKKYETNEEALQIIEETEKNPPKVDFRLLWELHQEFPSLSIAEVIGYLEMDNIQMTDAVRKLGICAGILYS